MPAMPNNPLIESVRALAEAQGNGSQWVKMEFPKVVWGTDFSFPALLAALERAERIEALLKRGTQAGISNYPNQFVHFSYADGQEIAALLSEPQ